jgi:hypothetical protein
MEAGRQKLSWREEKEGEDQDWKMLKSFMGNEG